MNNSAAMPIYSKNGIISQNEPEPICVKEESYTMVGLQNIGFYGSILLY